MSEKTEKKKGFWDYATENPGYTLIGVFLVCGAVGKAFNDKPFVNLSYSHNKETGLPDCANEKSRSVEVKGQKYTITCQ